MIGPKENTLIYFKITYFFKTRIHSIFLGTSENWHGHVTAVTCSPQHRRLGLAANLMSALVSK